MQRLYEGRIDMNFMKTYEPPQLEFFLSAAEDVLTMSNGFDGEEDTFELL